MHSVIQFLHLKGVKPIAIICQMQQQCSVTAVCDAVNVFTGLDTSKTSKCLSVMMIVRLFGKTVKRKGRRGCE